MPSRFYSFPPACAGWTSVDFEKIFDNFNFTMNLVRITASGNGKELFFQWDPVTGATAETKYRLVVGGDLRGRGQGSLRLDNPITSAPANKMPNLSKKDLPDGKLLVRVLYCIDPDVDNNWQMLVPDEEHDISALQPEIGFFEKHWLKAAAAILIGGLVLGGCALFRPKEKQLPTATDTAVTPTSAPAEEVASENPLLAPPPASNAPAATPPAAPPTPPTGLGTNAPPLILPPVLPVSVTNTHVASTSSTNTDTVHYIPIPVPYATNSGTASTNATPTPGFVIDNHGTHGIVTYAGGQTIIANTVNIEAPQVPIAQSRRDSLYVPVNMGQKKVTIPADKIARIHPMGVKVRPAHDLPPSTRWMVDGMTLQEAVNDPSPQEIKIYNDGATSADIELKWGE